MSANKNAVIGDLLRQLSRAPALSRAATVLSQIGREIGCELIATAYNVSHDKALRDEKGEIVSKVLGWPGHMIDHWERQRYILVHPVHMAARVEWSPFYWTNKGRWSCAIETDRLQRKLLHSIYDIGVKGGITVPVHMPMGHVSAVSFTSFKETDWNGLLADHQASLIAAASLFVHHARRAQYQDIPDTTHYPRLTRREIECVNLVAAGSSDTEIAEALSLSYPTVRFHLENAGRKLKSRSRGQTAARAAQLGILRPGA